MRDPEPTPEEESSDALWRIAAHLDRIADALERFNAATLESDFYHNEQENMNIRVKVSGSVVTGQ